MKVIGLGCILLLLLIAAHAADANVDEKPTTYTAGARQVVASGAISTHEAPIVEPESPKAGRQQGAIARLD
jgi:hypothetical protein